jgi:predicted GNAT family acetyltransferase
MAELRVTRSPDEHKYLLLVGELEAGYITYAERDSEVILFHTEVDGSVEGRGLGSTLVSGALDDIRARGLQVVALCPFVRAYLKRHPEYADLVART